MISINRESKLNALTIETLKEIKEAVDEAQANDEVHGMILTGMGDKAFAAGADISEFAHFNTEQATRMSADGHDVMNSIENGNKIVIAAVNGFALGGGCELAMMCDTIICGETAKFAQPEVKLGIPPGAGGSQRTPRAMGKAKAMDLCLTGRMMDAQEAERSGLVARVVPADKVVEEALAMASEMANYSITALMQIKELVNQAYEAPLATGLLLERRGFHAAFSTQDQKEGMSAFVEKRTPTFRGR